MLSLADLYKAIKDSKERPKGIAVSTEMWNLLKKAGVIEMKTGFGWGLFKTSHKFPTFQGDISIVVNPSLDLEKKGFLVPDCPHHVEAPIKERRRATDRHRAGKE